MAKFRFKVDEIRRIEVTGDRRFEPVELREEDYKKQMYKFAKEFDVVLPKFHELTKYGERRDLRILCSKISIFIRFADTSWLNFNFTPGFITDLASVPSYFRSVVDNDDSRLLNAVLVHDFLFSTHGIPFKYTNELFYQMCRWSNYPKFKSKIAYWAVSSIFGKRRWRQNKKKRNTLTRRTTEMEISRVIKIDGVKCEDLPRLTE